MSSQKKRILKLLAVVYVVLVVAFFVWSMMTTKGRGIERKFDEGLRHTEIALTEPLELHCLGGRPVSSDMVDTLLASNVTIVATKSDPSAPVGSSLVARGAVFADKVALPPRTRFTEALWEKVLVPEIEYRREHGIKAGKVYVAGGGKIMGFDMTLVFIVANFLGLLVLLYLLLWDPILSLLDKRAETIESDLSAARKRREEAGELKKKYDGLILSSKEERQDLIAEGRKEGESERERIVAVAREESDKIVERTRQELEAAAAKVRSELLAEIGGMSVDLAERILAREVNEEDNRRLVDDFLAKLDRGDQ